MARETDDLKDFALPEEFEATVDTIRAANKAGVLVHVVLSLAMAKHGTIKEKLEGALKEWTDV